MATSRQQRSVEEQGSCGNLKRDDYFQDRDDDDDDEDTRQEFCADSADFVNLECSQPPPRYESISDSLPQMADSAETGWTDEMHSSYLNSIEATFVKKLYEKEYCALDLCGGFPKEVESSDPDSAESRLSYPSPFAEFKVWQKGTWQTPPSFKLAENVAQNPVLQSPWVRHFRKPTFQKEKGVQKTLKMDSVNPRERKEMLKLSLNNLDPKRKAPSSVEDFDARSRTLKQSLTTCQDSKKMKASLKNAFQVVVSMAVPEGNGVDAKNNYGEKNELTAQNGHEDREKRITVTKRRISNVHAGCGTAKDQVVPLLGGVNTPNQ